MRKTFHYKGFSFVCFLFVAIGILLFCGGVLSNAVTYGYAASVEGYNNAISGLSLSYTNNQSIGGWNYVAAGSQLSGSATGKDAVSYQGCTISKAASETSTLTIKNNSSTSKAQVSFDYQAPVLASGGYVNIDGNSVTAAGSFHKMLDENSSFTVVIYSGSAGAKTSSIVLTSLARVEVKTITVTFKATVNGTYAVAVADIQSETTVGTADLQVSQSSINAVSLTAQPSSGYRFSHWLFDNGESVSYDLNPSLSNQFFNSDTAITPVFTNSSNATFYLPGNNSFHFSLDSAIGSASALSLKTIAVLGNGTVAQGNYTLTSGIRLLIPFDFALTEYTTAPGVVYGSHTTPTAFRILTLANGASITCKSGSSICVSSQICATGQMGQWNGCPTGPGGRINILQGGSITLEGGSNLYCWGYIYGSGNITAQSGATIYEAFQLKDWRGGTATLSCYGYVFPMSQYYIQNIECAITFYAGSLEKLLGAINAGSSPYTVQATFVGGSGSGALFQISSGYLVKDYIENKDRMAVHFYGEGKLSTLSIKNVPSVGNIDTADYELPINSNISVVLEDGAEVSVAQDVKFLPGSELIIKEGAKFVLTAGKNLYLYDQDEWVAKKFTGNAKLYVVGYSVTNGTTTMRTEASLKDASIDVNGALTIEGKLYTSAGGANIISSTRKGKIVFTAAPGEATKTIYEMDENKTKTGVTFSPAKLRNYNVAADLSGSPEYENTAKVAADSEFIFFGSQDGGDNKWHTYCLVEFGKNDDSESFVDDESQGDTSAPSTQVTKDSQWSYNFTYETAGWHYEKAGYVQIGWVDVKQGNKKYGLDISLSNMKRDYLFKPLWVESNINIFTYNDDKSNETMEFKYDRDQGVTNAVIWTHEIATSSSNDFKFTSAPTIKGWMDISGSFYQVGQDVTLTEGLALDLTAFRGGWLTRGSSTYFIEESAYDYQDGIVKGIFACPDRDDPSLTNVYKFDETTGALQTSFTGTYNGYLFVEGKAVTGAGLYRLKTGNTASYYFIQNDGILLTNATHQLISGLSLNGLLTDGYYDFNANGKLVETATNKKYYSGEDISFYSETVSGTEYICIDGIRVSWGLYKADDNHYRYVKQNGAVAKSETVYVLKTNGLLDAGLYYFDAQGYLYDFSTGGPL